MAKTWTFESITPATVTDVRTVVSAIAERHKIDRKNVHVRKGHGSVKHAVNVSVECSPEIRIEICEALLAAGFESIMAPYGTTIREHDIRLAREWAHTDVRVMVARCLSRPS